ncbi:MAG: bifunctional glutamate N-acetyltransferase/amino-acid acetyltransferase ArgJ [Acidimicrobiales bacterium]
MTGAEGPSPEDSGVADGSGGVTAAAGFVASGVACGLKASGDLDLALVATDDHRPVPAAAVFTANRAAAAPVQLSRHHMARTAGRVSAVVVNSGGANAATGAPGLADSARTASLVAANLGCSPEQVLVCSTGLIGYRLDMDSVVSGVPKLVGSLQRDGSARAARAIMTTDTVSKTVTIRHGQVTVGGMAKGAAMLAPSMATMLAVLTTDAAVESEQLQSVLVDSVERSFNCLLVDGAMSTNDTVILLASGRAGPVDPVRLAAMVAEATESLATQMAADAEGATKLVTVRVVGAVDNAQAARSARAVAFSRLVACSWHGADPYWGRVVSEVGASGVEMAMETISVAYGAVTVCRAGVAADHDRAAVGAYMLGRHLEVTVDLGLGAGQARVWTTDLGPGYIDENSGTS